MHLLPQLRETERYFGHELVIIGVHAGKFHAERETENIRQAVMRLEIEHPVVNDRQFRIWRTFGVNAWPTLVFIDPAGQYIGAQAGEVAAADLIRVVEGTLRDFEASKKISQKDISIRLERDSEPTRTLSFPGNVLAVDDNLLFISDSNHHRVLCTRLNQSGLSGNIETIAGSGIKGFRDGNLGTAAFCNPQGTALIDGMLYVADTGNHAIRRIDWAKGSVTTVAGTGKQAHYPPAPGLGMQTALNSPWDILTHDNQLFIAMAGSHQLWVLDITTEEIRPHAGTGGEALEDGPLREALLAQPSALTSDGNHLYFADSEASAIRWADYNEQGQVGTLVGSGLFDFGDTDGTGNRVRLQHPLGVAWYGGDLYIADTYNNKIKILDVERKSVATIAGTGESGQLDGSPTKFYEPGSLSAADGKLYVADTNNHTVRVVDLSTQHVGTLALKEPAGFMPTE